MNITIFRDSYLRRVDTIIQSEEINAFVANALQFVVQSIFINITNSFTFVVSSGEGPVEYWLHDTMNHLYTIWCCMSLQLVVLDRNLQKLHVPGRRYCNMIMIDSFKSLEKANIAEYNRIYDDLEYYFIFLQITDDRLIIEMQKIFRYCLDNYWLNCNVMIQNSKGAIYIYTYFPFQDGCCYHTEPAVINQFVGDSFVNAEMFPDKLKNLHLCPLKMNTWEVPPFIRYYADYKMPKYKISGFEMMMISALSRKMNFTLVIDEMQIRWDQIENYNEGPLEYLKNHETNISLGYYRRTSNRDEIATPSYVTYYLPLMAVVLRQQDRDESIGILLFPFDKSTWFLLIISCVIFAFVNCLQRKSNRVSNFQILEVLIGAPTNNVPRSSSRRIRFILWVLSTFILRSVYQSLLFYLYRTHFYKEHPMTLDGLAEGGYHTVCTDYSRHFVLNVPQILNNSLPLIVLNTSNEIAPLRYLEQHPLENLAAITTVDFVVHFVDQEMDYRNALESLPINVNYQQIVFYVTKHSYLIERFNFYIRYFHQAGLLESWRDWTNYDYKVTRLYIDSGYYGDYALMVNLNQLIGLFFVIIYLYLLSLVVFILELLSKNIIWLRKLFLI